MKKFFSFMLGFNVMLSIFTGNAWGVVQYTMIDLGGFHTWSYSTAYGINESGQVVGESAYYGDSERAFRTVPNSPLNLATDYLGLLNETIFSGAFAINESGQVVGRAVLTGSSSGNYRVDFV